MRNSDPCGWRHCLVEVAGYPKPLDLVLREVDRTAYEKRVRALEMKRDKRSCSEIKSETGISRQLLLYYMKATVKKDIDGQPSGYRALLPPQVGLRENQITLAVLESEKPTTGQLTAYFSKYPDDRASLYDMAVLHKLPGYASTNPPFTYALIHAQFLELARKKSIKAPLFPFNGGSQGAPALKQWVDKQRARFEQQQRLKDGNRRAKSSWSGAIELPGGCFREVQCDGHHTDVDWVIEAPGLNGEGVVRYRVHRVWLIAILDRRSTAVLGYTIAFGEAYNGADVARAVRSAMAPWERRKLSVTTIAYKEGECLPNALIPELSFMCWTYFGLDNALAHLSDYFLSGLERVVGCVPVFGPAASPDVRPNVEGLFHLLAEAGFHVVRGTLGSNPLDPRRDTKTSEPFLLTLDLLLDLVDLLVCRYNAATCAGTTITRLEILRRAVERERTVFRRVPAAIREDLLKYDLYDTSEIGTDKGRPVVRWDGVRYFGNLALNSRPGLIGQAVAIQADSEDVRLIKVSLLCDGTPLGILEVEPRFRGTAHSVATRKQAINYMRHSGYVSMAADIPLAFRHEVQKRHKERKGRASQLARLLVEQGAANGKADGQDTAVVCSSIDSAAPVTETAVHEGPSPKKHQQSGQSIPTMQSAAVNSVLSRIASLGSAYAESTIRQAKPRKA